MTAINPINLNTYNQSVYLQDKKKLNNNEIEKEKNSADTQITNPIINKVRTIPSYVVLANYTQYSVFKKDENKNVNDVKGVENKEIKEIDAPYKNNLKSMFANNEAVIMAIIMRSFNAVDKNDNRIVDGDEKNGTFLSAIGRLDELKDLGINTLHILPFHPTGKVNAMGTAGSIYSPLDLLQIDPMLDDPEDPRGVREECKEFIDECHKRGIKVMLDLPSCGSYELFLKRPELMAFDRYGVAKTPGGWEDIRMFDPYEDETKRTLNPELIQLHKDFVDMCIDLGIDGIRADVARAKPPEFWDIIINYSHEKDPEFAWLAETYTYEDASPQVNMPPDRPEDSLKIGFDSYYGQFHIFHEWTKASQLNDYVVENLEMSQYVGPNKSMIGSFLTHDDISLMYRGGVKFSNLTSGLQATLPMTNPYTVDGFQVGDYYDYEYKNTIAQETLTDSHVREVHSGKLDLFNLNTKVQGDHPEIGEFFKAAMQMRENNKDVITKGSYIPLNVEYNPNDEIIAFARHKDGKTLLVVANRNINDNTKGIIDIPGLKSSQELINLLPSDEDKSKFQCQDNKLKVDLGKGRIHVFEINTPNIEKSGVEVYRQNKK